MKGKVVLMHAGLPPGQEWQRPELRARYAADGGRQRFAAKAQLAAAAGARAIVAIEGHGFASALASGTEGAGARVLSRPTSPTSTPAIPVVRLSAAAGEAIVGAAGLRRRGGIRTGAAAGACRA